MSRIKNGGVSFVLFMALLCGSIGIASGRTTPTHTTPAQQIQVVQEAAVVGGSPGCAFAAGLAVGLDAAGLFGCIPCAVGGFAIGLGALIACT